MVPGTRAQCATKWWCKHCKGRDGKPFLNFAHQKACFLCHVPKGKCFLAKPEGPPSTRTRTGTGAAGAGTGAWTEGAPGTKRIKDLERQVADLQAKRDKSAAGDPEDDGDIQMGDEKTDDQKRDRIAAIDKHLAFLGEVDTAGDPLGSKFKDDLLAEKGQLEQALHAGKSRDWQLRLWSNKIERAKKKLEKQKSDLATKEQHII